MNQLSCPPKQENAINFAGTLPDAYDHVFIIHTHANAPQVRRLVQILRDTCANTFILVSHDRSAQSPPVDLRDVIDSAVILGAGGRGNFDIVDGYLDALRWLRQQGISYRWVSNISGQDYPIRSMREFLSMCFDSSENGFIHHFDAFQIDRAAMAPWTWTQDEGRQRYHFAYRRIAHSTPFTTRAAIWPLRKLLDWTHARRRINPSYGLMLGSFVEDVPFSLNFRCFAGSFWQTIDARSVSILLEFADERPDVIDFFRSTLIPDEAFVQTVLSNNPTLRLRNDNLRLIDMTRSRHGRPRVFVEDDLPEILASNKFFVRKLGGQSGLLLDQLDRRAAS